jgi:hypothetical protein
MLTEIIPMLLLEVSSMGWKFAFVGFAINMPGIIWIDFES